MHTAPYGWFSAGQNFSPSFMRHMYDYGTTPEQVAMVKVIHSEHASNNPKAYYKQRVTVDDVLNSRMIVKPLHLLDCCVETDNATAVIVTRAERAYDYRNTPARILGVAGRVCKPRIDMHFQHGPISTVAGYYIKDIIFPNAGVGPEDIDLTGAYDAFTFTSMLQLEDYGFCKKGEGGDYVSSGIMRLGGGAPQQHQRRAPLRGLHARHEHDHRERAPAPRRGRRLLPDRRPGTQAAHLRLLRRGLPPGARREHLHESRLGDAGHRLLARDAEGIGRCLKANTAA